MPFYHATHLLLQEGDIIEPGNWGRILKEYGDAHHSWKREVCLEYMRCEYFPDKPSRFNSTFMCDNIETITKYRGKNMLDGYIYEVDILEPHLPFHKGDFNAVEPMPNHPDNMIQIAYWYWTYGLKTDIAEWPGVECSEIVSASSVRVVRNIK